MRKFYFFLVFATLFKLSYNWIVLKFVSFINHLLFKQTRLKLLLVATFFFSLDLLYSQTVTTVTTTGSGTWVAPCGVTSVTVECWGGGGGGGNSNNTATNGGSGGGGGAYAKGVHTVTAGNTYYYNVGAGGTGGPASSTAAATAGTSSWFNASGTSSAPSSNSIGTLGAFGAAGVNNSTVTPTNQGLATSSFGNVTTASGTNGSAGTNTGGGAGGAGAAPGGGAGGAATTNSNGLPGTVPGGGGGGGDDVATRKGGDGAVGQITITYINIIPTITLGTNPAIVKGSTSANLPYTATTNSPNQYSITWSSAAITAGFSNVSSAALPASPIAITVPGTAPNAAYSGTITVTNTTTGCSSAGTPFTVTVSYPTIEAFPSQTFCASTFTTATAYNTVNFSLVETAATDFDANQTNQTIVLTLPAGFQFNTAAGAITVNTASLVTQDITINGFSITSSAITVTITTAATQANIDEINFVGFQIRASAAPSSGDLLRTGGTFKIYGSTSIPSSSTSDSFGHLATSGLSVYNSSTVTQYTTSSIVRGCNSTSNPILQFKLNITGGACTPNDVITKFVFSTTGDVGTTSLTDITKAEVYYTDTTQGFSNANYFGSVSSPASTFTITGSQALTLGNGPYYFYLTYTIPTSTVVGNTVDATMNSFTFNGTTYTTITTPNPVGGRTLVSGTCPSAPDLAPPTANTQTITAGSLVIPMDNTNQAFGGKFNLKAYGLVHALLQADIPVKWVIKSGKAKDAPDFIANAAQVYPTAGVAATYTFIASEFVVDSFYLDHSFYSGGQTATQVMASYTVNNVNVYQLTADAVVDVRYTLNHRPKIAVFSNGGYESVQTAMLIAGGVTNYFVQNAGDFTGLAECYTFCSEAHWDYSANPDTRPVQRVIDFVNEGGNFLAQCQGIDLYENHQPSGGHFQTTNGIKFNGNGTITNTDYNPDMAFCQYQGGVTATTGAIASFWTTGTSSYKGETYYGVSTPAATNTVVATGVHLADPDSVGSNVFYLGGHSYATTNTNTENGIRMYLNATLVPARRPTAFPITIATNPTICLGQSVAIGPVCASGATYAWSPSSSLNSATNCNPIASPTVTTAYTVVGFNGGCIMGPTTMTVHVNPTPVMTSTNSATICGNGSVSIPLTSDLTSTYQWIAADNPNTTGESITTQTTSTLNNTIINTTTSVQTVIYTVTPTSTLGSCSGTPQIVTVMVSPAPTMTSVNTATICANTAVSIPLAANIGGSTFTWIAADNINTTGESLTTQSTATLSNVITNTTTSVQNVIYTVTPTSGGCLGTAQTVTVAVNPTPVMTSTASATLCSGGTVSIPLTSNISSTYTWVATDNLNTTGESLTTQTTNTLSNSINNTSASPQDVLYSVTPTSNGCTGTTQTVTVTVNPTPIVTSAATATICTGAAVNIPLTSNVAGVAFSWIAADNVNTTGESLTTQSTNTLSNTITNSTTIAQNITYTVTPFAGGCSGTAKIVVVTVNPTPAMTSTNTATICSGGTFSIPLTSNVASNYTWIATDNLNTTGESLTTQTTNTLSNTIINNTTSAQNVIYTVTPTSIGGSCSGTVQTITVTVNPTPAMTSAATATICSGGTASITLASNLVSTYTWIATDNINTTGESLTTQSTNTLSNTITNNTTGSQNVIYTVTPTAGGCSGTLQTLTVTVNPIPTATATPTSQTICSNNVTSISLTSNIAGTTYSWTTSQSGVSGASNSSGTNIAQTLTAAGTSAGTAIYTITPTSTLGSCSGAPLVVTVTVNPIPTVTTTPTSQTFCSGNTTSIVLTSGVAGATYSWTTTQTGVSGATSSSGSTIAQTISTTGTAAGTAVYTITPTASSCSGTAITATVTVNPVPVMTSANSATICTAATVSIPLTSNVAATYTWIAADNTNTTGESLTTQSTNTLSNTITNGTTASQNVIYTVTPTSTSGSCVGAAQTVTVEVNPVPTATATPAVQTICSAGVTSITLTSNIAGTTYSWTTTQSGVTGASNGSGSSITQTLTTTGVSPGTVTYTITPANGCTGSPIVATVTVNPTPSMTSASTATICSGATASITLTSNVASTYTWIAANNVNTTGESLTTQSTNTLSNAIINNTITTQSVIYTVTPTSTGGSCMGTSQTVTLTINPTPSATATPASQTICSAQATSVALTSNIAGTTYSWTISQSGVSGASNSSGSNITQTLTATGTSTGTAIYTITPTSTLGSCAGIPIVVTVTVNPIPTVTATPTSQTFCSGNTTSIALTSGVAAATYSWTVTQTGVSGATSASGSNIAQTISTSGTATGTAVYTITPTASSCSGTAVTATVTVNPIPAMTSANSATICSNQTVNIPLTSNVASTYTWIAANNPNTTGESITTQSTSTLNNTIVSTTGNTETVIYTVTPTSSGGSCMGAAQTISVTISPTPIVTVTPTSQAFCSGNATSIALTSNVAGTIFNWTDTQTGVSGASAGSGSNITQTLTTTGVSAGTVTYTITPTIGTCTGASATATVTVNPVPSATATPSSQSICSGNATSIALTSNVGATTYSWTVSQSGVSGATSASGSSITQTLTTVGTTSGTATYTITPSTASCSGTPIVVTVTVNPVPSITSAPISQALCSGSATSIALTSNVAGTTFSWTDTQSAASGAAASSGSTITQTLTTTGTSPGTVTYTITPLAGTCTGGTTVATVTVNPIPVAPTASSNSPVCVTNTISFSVTTVAGASYNWSGPNSYTSNVQNASITNAALTDAGTYSVNVTVNGCTGPNKTLTVVVNPPPPSTVSVNSNSPVCTGQTLNLSTPSVTAASYSWSGPNSFSSSSQNPSISNVTLAANGTYTVSATVPGCGLSGIGTVSVVVNSTPVAPIAGNNGPLCVGATLTLTASNTGTTYNWTGPNTFTSTTQNPTVTNITSADAGVYSVTATSLGCTSTIGTTNVVVNPIPATPTVTSNSPLCVGQTLNLGTSAVGGASYSWNGPNSYTSSIQNPSISNVALVNGGTYSLAVTVSGCASATGTVDVAVNSTPTTPTASVNNPVCAGDTLFLSANSTGGATYSWTGPNTFTSNIQNPIIAGVTAAANGTYTVIANNGCASAPATVTVAVGPTPAAPVAGSNSPLCVGSTLNLTATNTGATYNWNGPNTYTSSVRNPSIANVTNAEAGVYTVTATSAAGCVSPTTTVNVVINSPAIVSAGGGQTVCANNSQVSLSGTSSTGAAQWSSSGSGTFTPNNTTLTSTYTPSVAEIAAGTSTLTLTSLSNGACTAVTDQMVITITPSPTVSTGGSQTVCANNSQVNLNGTFSVASGISWTSSGSGTFNPDNVTASTTYSPSTADITAGTVTLTIATTGNGNCLAATNTMLVTIKSAPVVNGGSDIFVCSNNPNATLGGTSSTGAAQWSTSGTGTFTPSNTSLNATYISSSSDISGGVVTLTLTSNNNVSCLAVSDTLTIKYTAPPTVNAGTLTSVCANNSAVALNGTSSTGAGAWTTSGTGTFTPNNTTLNATYLPSATDATAGTVTFTLTSTNNGGCIPVTSATTVTITPSPTANAGADQSVCGNNANVALTGSVTVASGGTWSSTGSGSFTPNNTNLNTTYIPSNADTAAGSVKIILTTSGNGNCNATTDTMLVTITNAPHVSAGVDANVCLSNVNYALSGYSSTGAGIWSTLGTGTFTPNNTTLNATYIPSTADTSAKNVTLILTSANNNGCSAVTDTMKIIYTNIPAVNAGGNQTVCGNNANVTLNGSSSTGMGAWATSGTGTFTPNNTTLNGTYIPSGADTAAGNVTLTLSSNGGCTVTSQTISVIITDAPGANAGADVAVCANNATVTLNGSVSGATSTGIWSANGTGTFNPDNTTLNATYVPSSSDTTSGSVTMILTSSNNGTCVAATDTMKITYTHAPHTTVASDATVCANSLVALSGTVSGGTGNGIWTTTNGSGTFTPNNTTLNASYNTVNADTVPTSVMLILTSTNNGGCLASSDTMLVTVNPGPIVNAGTDQTMCANNVSIVLSGTVAVATGGKWNSLGTGTFTPNNTTLNASYNPSAAEISSGTITIILTSTGNGLCQAVTDTMKVNLTPAPVVNAGSDIFICNSSTTAALNGSVSGGSTTGQWTTLGSGSFTPNDNTLNATYNLSTADTTAGTVKLVLTSTNNLTCNAVTDTVVIKLNSAPIVFAGNDTTLCGNVNAVALNGSISGSVIGHWTTHGDGTFTPNDSTLNGTYTAGLNDISTGSVVLTLTSNTNGQCSASSDSVKINFSPATIVNAGTNIPVCNGMMTAQLNGSVSGGTNSGQWTTLGSGTFTPNDTTLNAVYNLSTADTTAGSVKVVLTSTHNNGCSAVSDTIIISMTTVPITNAGNDTSICGNTASVPLHGSVTGGSGLGAWTSNGTGTFTPDSTTLNANYLPSAADASAGAVTLTLSSIQNGSCPQSVGSMKIIITPTPTVNAGSNIAICNGAMSAPLNGSITGGTTTGIWNTLGSGTFTPNDSTLNAIYNISAADSTSGSVSLVLSSTHNGSCSVVRDTVLITLNSSSTVNVGNDTSICSSITNVQLNGTITGGSPTGLWTSTGTGTFAPNDSTLNATYQPSAADVTAGNVILTLVSTHNCLNSKDSLKLTIIPTPIVNAGPNIAICNGTMSASLSGTVTGGTGTVIWSTLGSGNFTPTDTALNTTYNLSAADSTAGSVSVILTSTHNGSCSASADTVLITINSIPTIFAGNDTTICSGAGNVQLHGLVNGGSGTGVWYSFGTGTFTPDSVALNANYNPSASDITNGSVTLVLTSTNNCVNKTDTMKITFAPTATVSAGRDTSICASNVITLNGSVTAGSIAHWSTIGTGTFTPNDSTLNATYMPASTDNDTLTFVLAVNQGGSCGIVRDTMMVYRNGQPSALFSVNNACIGQSVSFTDNSTANGGSISTWYWSFGTGDTSTVQNPSYTYTTNGTYSVHLVVAAGGNCKDSITKTVTINAVPVPSFTLTANCLSDSATFTNSSTISQGNIASWSWSFGDGTSSGMQNPHHLYDSLATYTVSLSAVSDLGCSASITHTLVVHPSPLAGLTAQSNCLTLQINFKDTSKVILPDSISSYNWNFGDGSTSAASNPSHTYSAAGTYTVLLQVTSNNGCTDTATKVIATGTPVKAQYIPEGGTYHVNQNIDFTNQSTGASTYSWSFGDNSTTSTVTDPSHSFNTSGIYTVTLIASNSMGCNDTVKHEFAINSGGHTIPTGFTPNGDGLNDYFYIMGGPFDQYELRVFNEWGQQIFISNSQADKWDGTFNGKAQPAGTYRYTFNGSLDGQSLKLSGEINIIQ